MSQNKTWRISSLTRH